MPTTPARHRCADHPWVASSLQLFCQHGTIPLVVPFSLAKMTEEPPIHAAPPTKHWSRGSDSTGPATSSCGASDASGARPPQVAIVNSNDGNTLLSRWCSHVGICASSACDARSTAAPARVMTTDLVFVHLSSCGLLWSPPQHSRRSLTGLLLKITGVFTILLGSRSSCCSRRLWPLRRTPLCLSFITTRRGLQPHSVRREVAANLEDPILLHYRLTRIRLHMPDVALPTAEDHFMPSLQQGAH